MTVEVTQIAVEVEGEKGIESDLQQPARELMLFRLRCARTANGLSHYYMYGDLEPDGSVL